VSQTTALRQASCLSSSQASVRHFPHWPALPLSPPLPHARGEPKALRVPRPSDQLEDGKRYRTLKKHLARLGLTPAQYRAKWGLPSDYPMVAASYSAKRSELARNLGLGRKRSRATGDREPMTSDHAMAAEW
jgi:hypothetical protein